MRIDAVRLLILSGDNELLDESIEEVPKSVEASNVLSFLTQRFGEPLDVAWTATEELERVDIGWVFPLSDEDAAAHAEGADLIAVPLIKDRSGEFVSLFEQVALQRKAFENARGDGLLDNLTVFQLPHEQWKSKDDN